MNPLLFLPKLVIGAYKFVSKFPMFWRVIRNWHEISEIFKEGNEVLKQSLEQGHPNCEQTQKMFALCRRALETGVIDFPDFDEAELVSMLYDLENNLICSVNRKELSREQKG